ncbi:malate synthase A [Streptomyces sp. NPDC052114]|uniref:malate synthase n=1 Tax=unclassified Streptomyces TaxID=2593676 RepID=UPI00343CF76D
MPTTTLSGRVEVLAPDAGRVQALRPGLRRRTRPRDRHGEILTPEALDFIGRLDEAFAHRRLEVLAERRRRAARLTSGDRLPDFSLATSAVRADPGWRVAPPAPGLTDRRVEITGPPDRRTIVDALNSGARVWVADFADATAPTWENIIGGQLGLLDATERRIDFATPEGKEYRLGEQDRLATVVVRPRGWHLTEDHLRVEGRPVSASLVDFGLYFFHCARRRIEAGQGPYFSLAQLENRDDARLWNDVFVLAQELLGIPRGTIRATVVVETVTAAFEMEEILYQLREHSAGLAVGHPGHLAGFVRNFPHRPDFVLPDRTATTTTAPFLRAWTDLLVHTCHKRGAHAIGGTADRLPHRDPAAHEAALAEVRLAKEQEAEAGFDGSRVAHPALVPVCREVFDGVLADRPHQLERARDDVHVTAADLLAVRRAAGPPTGEGVRGDIAVALRYFDAWLRGHGVIAAHGRAADAQAAELARCRLWQRVRHGAVDRDTVARLLDAECAALTREQPGALAAEARVILERTALARELPAFFATDAATRRLARRQEVRS